MPQFLEQTGAQWRVVVHVPLAARSALGGKTKLKEALGRVSREDAERMKWEVVTRLKRRIDEAMGITVPRVRDLPSPLELEREAREAAERIPDDPLTAEAMSDEADDRAEELLGEPTERGRNPEPLYDAQRVATAQTYHGIATGRVTPLDALLARWHAHEVNRIPSTKGDDIRAVRYLTEWCRSTSRAATVQAIDRRAVGKFMEAAIGPTPFGRSSPFARRTVNKYLTSLTSYWKWMKQRGHVSENPWEGQQVTQPTRTDENSERPFRDEEVALLLQGSPSKAYLADLMRIAALTGARIDAIVCLQVRHCKDGWFSFKPQKRETGRRRVPIHSALLQIIEARTSGKADTDDLFPELPPHTSGKPRSNNASVAFSRYRVSVGVNETREGNRRALTNFHSFRRWFITTAEQAGQPVHVIESVVGHKRAGMSLGRYSRGPSDDQLRACVEAVQLPAS